jgi:hypothetical protein
MRLGGESIRISKKIRNENRIDFLTLTLRSKLGVPTLDAEPDQLVSLPVDSGRPPLVDAMAARTSLRTRLPSHHGVAAAPSLYRIRCLRLRDGPQLAPKCAVTRSWPKGTAKRRLDTAILSSAGLPPLRRALTFLSSQAAGEGNEMKWRLRVCGSGWPRHFVCVICAHSRWSWSDAQHMQRHGYRLKSA